MTIEIEGTTQITEQWLRRKIGFLLNRGNRNHSNVTSAESHRNMIYSLHTHYEPSQAAIEEGIDAWARHTAASNGFSDLP